MAFLNELKTCPVCKTSVFADMDTCYNCMYQFGSNIELEMAAMQGEWVPEEIRQPSNSEDCLMREFLVGFERFLGEFLLTH